MMCISICIMICLGAALFVTAHALQTRLDADPTDVAKHKGRKAEMKSAIRWCTELAYLMGAVALLLILCCLCCRDVDFSGHHIKDEYD